MAAEAAVPSSQIDRQTVGRAVDSLLKWLRAQTSMRKAQLLEHDEPLRLILSLQKIPAKGRTNPYLISLPHPLLPLSGPGAAEVCLIADDRPSAPATPAAAEQKIRDEGIPVSELISLSSLRSDYKAYEARRKLRGSYDIFVADRRILPLLPRLIGNSFFKKKKHPLPIDLSRKGWPEQLKRCLSSATLYIRTGTCCQMDVGRASQGREEIIDNVIAAIEGSIPKIPKKWDNIRSIHLKFDESVALPIFRTLPEMGFKIETYQKPLPKDAGFAQKKKKIAEKESNIKKNRPRKMRYMDSNLNDSEIVGGDEEEPKKDSSKKRKKEVREENPEDNPNLGEMTTKKKKKIKDGKSDAGINGLKKTKMIKEIKEIDADSTEGKTKLKKKKIRQKL